MESGVAMDKEVHGFRDETFSQWHRIASMSRFIGRPSAQDQKIVDADFILTTEHSDEDPNTTWMAYRYGSDVVALIETSVDYPPGAIDRKVAWVTTALAKKAGIPAFIVLYTISANDNPMSSTGAKDIDMFRVKMTFPKHTAFVEMTPQIYAEFEADLRNLKKPNSTEEAGHCKLIKWFMNDFKL